MLSDKARGKQRATDNDDNNGEISTNGAPDQSRSITIRFTEREPDLLLAVSVKDSIRDLKSLVSPWFGLPDVKWCLLFNRFLAVD